MTFDRTLARAKKLSDLCFLFAYAMAYISTQESSFPLKLRIQNISSYSYVIHIIRYHLEIKFMFFYYGSKVDLLAMDLC